MAINPDMLKAALIRKMQDAQHLHVHLPGGADGEPMGDPDAMGEPPLMAMPPMPQPPLAGAIMRKQSKSKKKGK